MRNEIQSKILAQLQPEDFTGRESELGSLTASQDQSGPGDCTILFSAPAIGSSELMRQAYDRLFRERTVMPVYFPIDRTDRTADQSVRRFLYRVCVQAVAFSRQDDRIIKHSPTLDELERLAPAADLIWLSRVIEVLRERREVDAEGYSLATGLGAAVRAAESRPAVFFVDHFNEAEFLQHGDLLMRAFGEITGYPNARFVFSALRRSRIGLSKCREVQLDPLSHGEMGRLIEVRARKIGVSLSEQARDLIAAQAAGKPAAAVSLLRNAAKSGTDLDTFRQVQSAYTDELLGGGVARYYDRILHDVALEPEVQKSVVRILNDLFWSGSLDFPVERWRELSGLGERSGRGLDILNTRELVRLSTGRIEAMRENDMLADYIDARFRLEVGGDNRAIVVGDSLNQSLKRAPALMTEIYRRNTALGVRELLASFEAADVPAALLDYGKFRDEYKGAPDDETLSELRRSGDTIQLPQIVQSVHAESLYKPIAQVTETERCAVGRGFNGRRYSDDEEIVWFAAEIDSKMEATKELAEFWCDRLEMAALSCNFTRYKFWLIAPEGFSAAALELLNTRNAIGSSRRQAMLLRRYLTGDLAQHASLAEEYEIVVPMGEETELIAAHAVEEIAKRHNIDARSINQMKTALVEACINATEHSHSPDRKIYQKFAFDDEKITITISNRGLRLADRRPAADEPTEGRRGWGLALMRRLMDEVTVEDVDDGTMISMTKYLPRPA
ncbi:MAG: ATP-binding protein [Acidobacteriota bacterium]